MNLQRRFTDLCGNRFLQNDFMNIFCRIKLGSEQVQLGGRRGFGVHPRAKAALRPGLGEPCGARPVHVRGFRKVDVRLPGKGIQAPMARGRST